MIAEPSNVMPRYRAALDAYLETRRRGSREFGVDYNMVVTDGDYEKVLANFLLAAIPNPLGAASTGSLKKPGSLSRESSLKKRGGTSGDVIIIEPGTMTSGHELKRVDGDIYKLTNWYGRWVYCVTPEEEFFGFPNGSFLDVLRLKSPWAASERAITLSVPTSGNAVLVNVYGLGWKKETGNTWDALTDVEKNHVMRAGFSTIAFEFVPHIVSTLTNTSHVFNSTTIPKDAYVKVLTNFSSPAKNDIDTLKNNSK